MKKVLRGLSFGDIESSRYNVEFGVIVWSPLEPGQNVVPRSFPFFAWTRLKTTLHCSLSTFARNEAEGHGIQVSRLGE